MEKTMKRKFGIYIFLGLLIGTVFGVILGGLPGAGLGALVGAAIGWFIAAAVLEAEKKKKIQ
jgi:hypothetical protein